MEHRTLLALALTLAVLPSPVAGQTPAERDGLRGPGIVGTVVDRATRLPLEGVLVRLDAVGEGVEITEMAAEAVELDPLLVVTEARSRNLDAAGFYDRRARGVGRFVSRDDITSSNALRASDLFRTMPGVRMSSSGRFGEDGVVLLRGGCVADVFLDGVRTNSPFPMDALVGPMDLDGVEIYHGSEVPPRFGPSQCGAVVIWTHLPNPGTGRAFSWKKFLAALGVMGLSVLLLG